MKKETIRKKQIENCLFVWEKLRELPKYYCDWYSYIKDVAREHCLTPAPNGFSRTGLSTFMSFGNYDQMAEWKQKKQVVTRKFVENNLREL